MDDGEVASPSQDRSRRGIRWPSALLGPPPDLKLLNLFCWSALAAFVLIRVGVPLFVQLRTGVPSLHILPADFIYYYGDGRIANEYPLARFYDYSLQTRIYNEIFPLQSGAYGMQPYPPWVPLFFSLYARLPFAVAFGLWMLTSLLLYLAGIRAAIGHMFRGEPLKVSLVFCLALGFYPFLIGTLINGQPSAAAVFAVGMAIALERRMKPFSSGLLLSLIAYKPTLCVLLVPMLLITRRFKAFSGFVSGVLLLMLLSTAFGGIAIWPAYARYLGVYRRVVSLSDRSGMPLSKHIDIGSCLLAVSGGRSALVGPLLVLITVCVLVALAVLGWRSAKCGPPVQSLTWATALTWTLLVNVYVPIYDAVLVTIAVVLLLSALKDPAWNASRDWVVLLAVLIIMVSWVTSAVALKYGVQLITIGLAILGVVQLWIFYRSVTSTSLCAPAAASSSV
jgi:hypothetical protein